MNLRDTAGVSVCGQRYSTVQERVGEYKPLLGAPFFAVIYGTVSHDTADTVGTAGTALKVRL